MGESRIDGADSVERRSLGRSFNAGSEQRVDDKRRLQRLLRNVRKRSASGGEQHGSRLCRIAAQ